jgi:hypothetical protein
VIINIQEKEKSKYRYSSEIRQMMFVFGEVQEPLLETLNLVEDIIRSQVIEIVRILQIVNTIVMSYKIY